MVTKKWSNDRDSWIRQEHNLGGSMKNIPEAIKE
jgi:hypothetical protein